jgi:hypothetical protein
MNPILLTHSSDTPLVRMDITPDLAATVRELFERSTQEFQRGTEEIVDFDPGYHLQEGECFRISDFPVDEVILAGCRQPLSVERLQPDMISHLPIKSIVGYNFDGEQRRIYFQNFDSRRVMVPGRRLALFAMADTATFQELESPVILLDAPIVAIWDNGTLTFKSFHLTKRLFDLSAYFEAATDKQIEQFATHERFLCADQGVLLSACTEWHRRKIALILRSGILDNIEAGSLGEAGQSVGYAVPMEGDQIRIPTDKNDIRRLLQFLDEDIYKGAISHRQLISSSKRASQ